MTDLTTMGKLAKTASRKLASATTNEKNSAISKISSMLRENITFIVSANEKDQKLAKENGMSTSLIDRLMLNEKRISDIADACLEVVALDDPIGEISEMKTQKNGLTIGKQRVPLGVIAIIYEARPNVTVDSAVLCLKAGNAVILRGGKEAINTNLALAHVIREALGSAGMDENCVQIIADTDRKTATDLMRLNGYVDVLIPRGGASLIKSAVENATVPVIETGTGNCHIYIDSSAELNMGAEIIFNAKTSRPSVCNAAESLIVHSDIAEKFLPLAKAKLDTMKVELRGCERTRAILPGITAATEEDYYTEYNDYILSVKIVDSLDMAIDHINEHSTGHSEAIVTKDLKSARRFLNEIDSAAVYVNASTRFTDGNVFGMGAEIGISTQKLHARGPMALHELTSTKYIIYGDGQIRV